MDRAVWFIRRYCFYLRRRIPRKDGTIDDLFPIYIRHIQSKQTLEHPNKYSIRNGLLEKVLKDEKSKIRQHLVWQNFCFGTYKKHVVKNYERRVSFGNPAHYLFPQILPDLEKLVQFSPPVKEHFKNLRVKKKS